jgi:hypothetical protein
MANVTGGPVHKPDRGSLPLACEIGLGPHVTGFRPPPGAVRRAGGAPFADTPVRTLTPIRWDMSDEDQTNIIRPFTALWSRASPNGCVKVRPLRGGDAGIGPLMKAVMGSVNEESALSAVQWRTNVDDDVVKGVLTRFRGLFDPLGHQKGVLLAGVGDPLRLGPPVLFVNQHGPRPETARSQRVPAGTKKMPWVVGSITKAGGGRRKQGQSTDLGNATCRRGRNPCEVCGPDHSKQ